MSENITDLKKIEQIKKSIADLNQKEEKYAEKNTQYSKRQLKNIQEQKKELTEILKTDERRRDVARVFQKEQENFSKSFARLSTDAKKVLTSNTKEYSSYTSLVKDVNKMKAEINVRTKEQRSLELDIDDIRGEYTDTELADMQGRLDILNRELETIEEKNNLLGDIANSIQDEAKELAKTEAARKGISDFDQQRAIIQENIVNLTKEEQKLALDNLNLLEQLTLKNARIQEIQEEQESLYEALPSSIKEGFEFSKKLAKSLKSGALPMVLITSLALAALSSFTSLDDAAKEFRDQTGLTNSQMKDIKSQANDIVGSFANLGIAAYDVFDTVAALKSEFSDTVRFSDEIVAGLTVLSKNFGVSADNAATVQGILENVGGLSAETATSVQLQVANMSKLAGVAPVKVFEDMAGSAEIASTLFRGNIESFAKATIEARRLGTTIDKMGENAKGLLDFESSITEELTAAAMLGGDFNLTRARSLAYSGDLIGMQNEILDQVQKTGDFSKKDLYTQEQIAKATGMSVEEINKQLNVREKLKSLSSEEQKLAEEAMAAGLDLSNIKKEDLATQIAAFSKQQEQQAVLEQISNQFMGIAATIGSVLVPLLDAVLLVLKPIEWTVSAINYVFGGIGERISNLIGPLGDVGRVMKGLAGLAIVYAAYKAYASFAVIPVAGAIKGAIAAAAILSAGFATLSKIGDLSSPADGKTRISTKEGGLFELSPNDDVIAAPGLVDAMSAPKMGDNPSLSEMIKNAISIEPITTAVGAVDNVNPIKDNPSLGEIPKQSTNTESTTSPALMDISGLINEIKGLRADLNSGKVAVYMDGKKVSSSVNRVMDKIGTNFYGAT